MTGGVDRSQGATRAISSYIDPGLNWEDRVQGGDYSVTYCRLMQVMLKSLI